MLFAQESKGRPACLELVNKQVGELLKMKPERWEGPDFIGFYRPWREFRLIYPKYSTPGGFQAKVGCDILCALQKLLPIMWRIGCTTVKWKQLIRKALE